MPQAVQQVPSRCVRRSFEEIAALVEKGELDQLTFEDKKALVPFCAGIGRGKGRSSEAQTLEEATRFFLSKLSSKAQSQLIAWLDAQKG